MHNIPYAAPGLSGAFKWKPIQGSGTYIAGVISDLNAVPGEFDWSGLFDFGEIYAGLELGKNWIRGPGDFDHFHVLFSYADARTSIPLRTASGWGFKVHGTKQWGSWVGFANYTYNTVEGGGFGIFTNSDHGFTTGLVKTNPFNVKGEIGMAFMLANPKPARVDLFNQIADQNPGGALFPGARSEVQTGFEAYWRLLVLRQLWVTPGFQFHWNPTFNENDDVIFAPVIKARAIL